MNTKITSNKKISPTSWEMKLTCPEIVQEAKPGQFVMVRIGNDIDAFLRRPLSIHDIKNSSSLELLYKVVGRGTEIMRGLKKGDNIDILGPLGKGFEISNAPESAILIAGGIGVAPLGFLLRSLRKRGLKKENIYFLYGAKTRSEILFLSLIKDLGAKILIATEDGSLGKKGMINGQLEKLLKTLTKKKNETSIFASGPNNMLKVVSSIAEEFSIPCQISLEANMACGFGVCLGCAVKIKNNDNGSRYKMVCKDGPVFEAGEIVWQDL